MTSTFTKALNQVTGVESIKSKISRATQDDETPTPGYLQEELKKLTQESSTCCEVEDHLLGRLQVKSSNVKVCRCNTKLNPIKSMSTIFDPFAPLPLPLLSDNEGWSNLCSSRASG
jgi:hypothetical protein